MHELYGNAYERCDYFHGGMGYPSSWGQHASTIMQSVMTAEERGYPMEKELFDYVAERAEVLATNDASTQQPHGRLPLRRMRAMKPLRPLPTSCLTCSRVVPRLSTA